MIESQKNDVDVMHVLKLMLLCGWVFMNTAQAEPSDRINQALVWPKRTANTVFRDRIQPHWSNDGKILWYRVATDRNRSEFVQIDTTTGERKTATTLKELGISEPQDKRVEISKSDLPKTERTGKSFDFTLVNELDYVVDIFWVDRRGDLIAYGSVEPGENWKQQTYEGHVWLVAKRDGDKLEVFTAQTNQPKIVLKESLLVAESKRRKREEHGVVSPDGKWSVTVERGQINLIQRDSNQTQTIKSPLGGKHDFRDRITWSPDSSSFVACSSQPLSSRQVAIVESSPIEQLQPRLREFEYNKPGDPLPHPIPVLIRIQDQLAKAQTIESSQFAHPFVESNDLPIHWSSDSREFYFDYNQRGHQVYRVLAVDAQTSMVRKVVEETSRTFIDWSNKTWRHWLPKSQELLWMSERDGWCHLWLYDVASGAVKNQVTHGEWVVRRVLHVDEQQREVWFLACGLRTSEDPYHLHLCRVNFDGSGFVQLTVGDGQHEIKFSPTREFFIDHWSRVDQPPIHELRRSRDGSLICVLETANIEHLLRAGWTMPERFVAKGRDGRTDIYGVIVKPSHFDPTQRYPVVEEIYAGPQSAYVPKKFDRMERQHMLAELGFIVVRIDGMGTNHRGKAFHEVCWKNLKDAGFSDRIAWLKTAATTRPWMDLQRVGIYGGSAGGQNAMRALLDHHDFYHVAVADCGCHDNRMDKLWWNEQWLGWPLDHSYLANSNAVDAHKMQGKLLLIVGELDTNVDPASTMQVVGALQKAGKSFEFMPIVGVGHGAAETPWASRLRMEFLVKHLLK